MTNGKSGAKQRGTHRPGRKRRLFFAILLAVIALIVTAGTLTLIYGVDFLRIKATGVSLKPSKVIEPYQVAYYLQDDPEWSADKLGNSNTNMDRAGCLVACIATVLDYCGLKYTPQEVNRVFGENGVFTETGQVIWMNIHTAVPGIDYLYDRVFTATTMETLLDEGMLPIIKVKYKGTGAQHWVVVIGSDGTDFLVMDPRNQSKTPLKLSMHGNRAYAYRTLIKTP